MRNLGIFSLYLAHALCLWGLVVSLIASLKKDLRYLESAKRSLFLIFVLNLISVASLIVAFVRDDFTIKYVFEYSRKAQPLIYKITALWGGMDGSLLLWEFILSFYCVVAIFFLRRKIYNLLSSSSFIFFLLQGFFLFLLTFKTNPFSLLIDADGNAVNMALLPLIDGNGLNPLLQNVYMAVHPPLLYLGFVGFAIPFSLILSVLWEKEKRTLYLLSVRDWIFYSWLSLGIGILFGSYWAYIELGWGGYWAWDPDENASLIPWLTATALLHTLFLERKRKIFKALNYCLIVATFLLSIYGTYLTRSGVLQSVHSFGAEEKNVPIIWQIGNIFLAFMALIIALSIIMAFLRRGMLKPQKEIKSEISKESIIFYGVILVLLLASVVFYGVTSPIFYKIFLGKELHNGIDFYNPKAVPIALFILLIVPIANIATWEKGEAKNFFRKLIIPSLFGVLSILLGLLFLNYQSNWLEEVFKEKKILFYFLLLFFNIGFFLSISIGEYLKEARKAKQKATSAVEAMVLVFKEKKKKLGVSLIHFGIIVFCFGIAFSSFFQENYEEDIRVGESFKADGVVFSLARLTNDDFNQDIDKVNQIKIWAEIDLYKNSKYIGTLKPMRVHYKSTLERGQPPSYEVAIKSSLFKDYYIILGGFDLIENRASLTLHVNTFVSFLWLGGFIILIGGILALVYEKRIIWY